MLAGFAGDEVNTFPDTGHTSKIQDGSNLLAGRTAQASEPLINIRVDFFNGFCRDADLKSVGTMGTTGFKKILRIAFSRLWDD